MLKHIVFPLTHFFPLRIDINCLRRSLVTAVALFLPIIHQWNRAILLYLQNIFTYLHSHPLVLTAFTTNSSQAILAA